MSNEIENSWIDIESACGGSFGAYVSLPPAGFGPGLLVIQEIFGVNDHIKNVCDQYALDGFVALRRMYFGGRSLGLSYHMTQWGLQKAFSCLTD